MIFLWTRRLVLITVQTYGVPLKFAVRTPKSVIISRERILSLDPADYINPRIMLQLGKFHAIVLGFNCSIVTHEYPDRCAMADVSILSGAVM